MNPPFITIVLITAQGVLRECFESIASQDYSADLLDLVVNYRPPEPLHQNEIYNKYGNCSRNRNEARERALRTKGEYFLFLDDDIVLPTKALALFAEQAISKTVVRPLMLPPGLTAIPAESKIEVIGGYYPILGTSKYVCGRWVADNTFYNYTTISPGFINTDVVGLGCAFVSRRVLEAVKFEAGTDVYCTDAATQQTIILGECGMFGNRVNELGVTMYMCGDVVCEHLARPVGQRTGSYITDERDGREELDGTAIR